MDIYGIPVGTQGTKGSIDSARRPGRGSIMCPTINEESDCPRKKIAAPPLSSRLFLSTHNCVGKGPSLGLSPSSCNFLKNALYYPWIVRNIGNVVKGIDNMLQKWKRTFEKGICFIWAQNVNFTLLHSSFQNSVKILLFTLHAWSVQYL